MADVIEVGAARGDAPPPAAKAARRAASAGRTRRATPYLFLAPYLVLFGVFGLLPIILGVWLSVHQWDFQLPNRPFVGLDNYKELFSSDSAVYGDWWESVRATAIFTVLSVPLLVVVPLGLALLLNRSFPGRTFFRAVYFAPYVLGVAVIGLLWRFLLDANLGLVNRLLGVVGLPSDTPWVTNMPWAWISLVGVTVWWTSGFNAVIYLAGLQDISPELYEAARMDGANAWQRFRSVTLPGLRPVLLFVITTTVLASANMFGQSFLITQGTPGTETRTVVWFIVEEGLRDNDAGRAAAMSIVFALMLAVVSLANFRLFRYKED
ncbi:carbohydrate ABC transporter permease [Micromonospora parathelypteridis]|uniref:Multiple sugar transport system permease protein n=1 Tax=Micromonospora parathelypteridis TaxID=1839617 RepID=A0A840W0A9_9ACTN|nr:sugar ABC transporter permease [Micromonospora parathelypteridis]MBB5477749.1 multiple sugar transport system permease protein [Micromonospora parathelypteridis]GGO11427.1 glycerol-3-phosphate ABC transporter permease [Micromonospora parathelypteridis]